MENYIDNKAIRLNPVSVILSIITVAMLSLVIGMFITLS